jgi:hypothetical protein
MLASANRAQAGPAEDTRTAANSSLISGFGPAVSTARDAATANAVAPTLSVMSQLSPAVRSEGESISVMTRPSYY